MSELINATTTKGRKASTVFGSGLVMNLGIITSNSRIIRGYRESGRTRVPPPMPPGNNGKLLIGSVIKKRTQQIFEIDFINFAPSIECQRKFIYNLCG
jgi:hypothetical protein